MLKNFLLSEDSDSTEVARKIDDFSKQDLLQWDPLLKFQDDKGMQGFLSEFYELVFLLAQLLPHSSAKQDKLVQLIVELRKLPTRELKIWGVRYVLLYSLIWIQI